ncbi:unnamed protein product [Phytophthora fragariaefolia]|uniref:Unnamed protein product n=1 Tax=Phytophthora fragariaefolia TaxID=1490495 RepID=A0A9W6Y3B3_9STRA|nr:unnamed protein product [Phytophthora fragariaefolia]
MANDTVVGTTKASGTVPKKVGRPKLFGLLLEYLSPLPTLLSPLWWSGIGNFAVDLDPSTWDEGLGFAFTLPGTGYILARPTLRRDIEYPKIEVNPDAEIAWPDVCQLSFQPTARGSGKQGKEYPPKATPGQDRHRPTSPDQRSPRSTTQPYIGAASRNIPAAV